MTKYIYKVDVIQGIVALGLVISLIVSLFTGATQLSMCIASGLTGYIGGNLSASHKSEGKDSKI